MCYFSIGTLVNENIFSHAHKTGSWYLSEIPLKCYCDQILDIHFFTSSCKIGLS